MGTILQLYRAKRNYQLILTLGAGLGNRAGVTCGLIFLRRYPFNIAEF